MNSLLLTSFPVALLHKLADKRTHSDHDHDRGYSYVSNIPSCARIVCCKTKSASEREGCSLSSSVSKTNQNKEDQSVGSSGTLVDGSKSNQGIGIMEFLRGKTYFITGGTGFLGKAVIEKILRESPEMGKIYVLIKALNEEAAFKRLKTEIIDSDLFHCLRLKHGDSYEAFMLSKLVSFCGNVCESNLGVVSNSMATIAPEIDVIINLAANTSFDDRFDVAVNTNTKGPSRVLNFAKMCKKLCAFIHVSTAFVNRASRGRVPSPPPLYHPVSLDVDAEMKLAFQHSDSSLHFHDTQRAQQMKQLGLERARNYGWRNVYELSKAMGEISLTKDNTQEFPIVIVRPSIVESSFKQPFPGWIEGNRMLDPLILSYGKGYLPVCFGSSEAFADVIPLDMVVNVIIAAMAKHGTINAGKRQELSVYHVVSSGKNPLMFGEMFDLWFEHFKSFPLVNMKGETLNDIKRVKFLSQIEDTTPYLLQEYLKLQNETSSSTYLGTMSERRCKKLLEYNRRLANIYAPYSSTKGLRFNQNDTQKLVATMSEEEIQSFGFDVEEIDWRDFFVNIHIPGLKKYVLKGRRTITN